MTTVEELARWAELQGFGTIATNATSEDSPPGVLIYENYVPPKPSDVLCFLEEGGREPTFVHAQQPGIAIEHPYVAAIVRAADNRTARNLIERVFLAAAAVVNSPIVPGGVVWQRALPQGSPRGDGLDPEHRWFRFRILLAITKQPSG